MTKLYLCSLAHGKDILSSLKWVGPLWPLGFTFWSPVLCKRLGSHWQTWQTSWTGLEVKILHLIQHLRYMPAFIPLSEWAEIPCKHSHVKSSNTDKTQLFINSEVFSFSSRMIFAAQHTSTTCNIPVLKCTMRRKNRSWYRL